MRVDAHNLIKDGAPKYIRCYVNKKALAEGVHDPYTVVFTKANCWQCRGMNRELRQMYLGKVLYIGMTQNGEYAHGESDSNKFYAGTPIKWKDLTWTQRRTVVNEYEDCWGIKMFCDPTYEFCIKVEYKEAK
jgi:hypothetical protein